MPKELLIKAKQIRRGIVQAVYAANSGHPGGSLSAADIMTSLFFEEMRIDPDEPNKSSRDLFVLCKGHAAPALYATLAARGYFAVEELLSLRKLDSRLQGHPDMRKLPGVDYSTGSLGLGLSAAVGMALAAKTQQSDQRVYALLGDGELQEGQVWEAAMAAAHYKLTNLVAIIDNNGLQIDGNIGDVMNPYPLVDKWLAFGWHVLEIDGHSFDDLNRAFKEARIAVGPTVIIAKTVKGKGVSFMEGKAEWHGKAPSEAEFDLAMQELGEEETQGEGN